VRNRLGLLTLLVAASALAADTLPRVENLKFPTLREVTIPNVTTFRLPNGMRVYMLENHELPLVSGTALVRHAGSKSAETYKASKNKLKNIKEIQKQGEELQNTR